MSIFSNHDYTNTEHLSYHTQLTFYAPMPMPMLCAICYMQSVTYPQLTSPYMEDLYEAEQKTGLMTAC